MSYLEKYLKYKNKYLDLLNQVGGAKCYECGTEISQTDQICPKCNSRGWGCLDCRFRNLFNRDYCGKCKMIRAQYAARDLSFKRPKLVVYTFCPTLQIRPIWQNYLMKTCLRQLPDRYEMKVVHLDPLSTIIDTDQYCKEEIESAQDDKYMECHVENAFSPDTFKEIERVPCHLLIDMVSILGYTNPKQVRDSIGAIFPLSSVNVGNVPNFSDLLAQCKIFSIQPDGSVITYIDKMIVLGYNFDRNAPFLFIFDLLRQNFDPHQYEVCLNALMNLLFDENLNPNDLVTKIKVIYGI